MTKRSRVLIGLASLALGLMLLLPVWTITLEAPQYPEGLGMVIRINTIEGQKPHDLANINGLNHYIGMREIVPDSIPELRVMPYLVAGLVLAGLLVALLGRRRLLYGWIAAFVGLALIGMADFYKWEYDYGHNLNDEVAIIKIPGMSYQPPLIGSRQILNFKAHSWPGAGGWAAILACATGVAVAGMEWRRARQTQSVMNAPAAADAAAKRVASLALFVASLAAAGCGDPGPRALMAGADNCQSCLMTLDASGHGSELVSRTGKIYTFDSVECLVNFVQHGSDPDATRSLWVTDFSNPDELVPAEDAYFLISATLGSPMGLGITAFARQQDRDGAVHAFGGEPTDWLGVRSLVARAWPDGRPTRPHGGHESMLRSVGGA